MYRRIELSGRHGFAALTPEAGSTTSLSVPDVDRFRFEMEICDVGSIVVSNISMTPHHAMAGTVEDADVVNLMLMVTGEQRIDARGERVTVSAGQISVQVGWNRHEAVDAAGSTILLMQIDRLTLLERGVRLGNNEVVFGPDQPTLSTHALHSMATAVLRWRAGNCTATASLGVENSLVDLVAGLHRESLGRRADSLELAGGLHTRALTVADTKFTDPALTPATLSEHVQVPLRTLQRVFSAHGTTIAAHLRGLRTRHAVRLLEDPECRDLTVEEIAAAAGFTSSAELRRALRADRGITPRDLRPPPPRHPSPQ